MTGTEENTRLKTFLRMTLPFCLILDRRVFLMFSSLTKGGAK
jgi:hypothetical protein